MEMHSLHTKHDNKGTKQNETELKHSVISIETHTADKSHIWQRYIKRLFVFGLNSSYPEFTLLNCGSKVNTSLLTGQWYVP